METEQNGVVLERVLREQAKRLLIKLIAQGVDPREATEDKIYSQLSAIAIASGKKVISKEEESLDFMEKTQPLARGRVADI